MESLELFLSAENECEEKTNKILRESFALNDELLDLNLRIYDQNFSKEPPLTGEYPFAVIVLQNEKLKSLRCLSILLKKGYYSEFHSILRDVLDISRRSQFFLKHPEKSIDWINGEEIKFGKINPELSDSENWGSLYGNLCDFTHRHIRSTFWETTLYKESHELSLSKKPTFQKPVAYSLISDLLAFNFLTFLIFEDFLKTYHNDLDQEDIEEFKDLLKRWFKHSKKVEKFQSDPKNIAWRDSIKSE
ncbi:MAG: hypothetical protein ABSG49_05220 [Methanoregula sp.]|jgi:hypothetical protein|uniref:hypothetical protein n=1 Tax=Methanoregula sp. TaxID=2052170 RepID=UPI003C243D67